MALASTPARSYPEAAWELLKFLTSQEYGRAMAQAQSAPARARLAGGRMDRGIVRRASIPDKTNNMDIGIFAEGHINNYSVTAEIFANMEDAAAHRARRLGASLHARSPARRIYA